MGFLSGLKTSARNVRNALQTQAVSAGVRLSFNGMSPRMRHVINGGYEKYERALVDKFVGPEDRILDVGSSIGFLAIYCLKVVGVKHLAMVEPNPDLVPVMARNFALNDVPMPALIEAAVGDGDGKTWIGINIDAYSSSAYEKPGQIRSIEVKKLSLASVLASLQFSPNVLLMDIEGTEARIPAEHFLPFDTIIMETHPKITGHGTIGEIVSSFQRLGYEVAGKDHDVFCFRRSA